MRKFLLLAGLLVSLGAQAGLQVYPGPVAASPNGTVANTGYVGAYSTNTTSGTSLTTGVTANCTSTSLPAGVYDVTGIVTFTPQSTTTVSALVSGINTVSATIGGAGTNQQSVATFTTGSTQVLMAPVVRLSFSSTTTVYLVAQAAFGTSTMTCNGFIRATVVN